MAEKQEAAQLPCRLTGLAAGSVAALVAAVAHRMPGGVSAFTHPHFDVTETQIIQKLSVHKVTGRMKSVFGISVVIMGAEKIDIALFKP